MTTGLEIITEHQSDFIYAASQVGIDGMKLLNRLPRPGTMLKGLNVPVLEKKYRYTCSVLLYINTTRGGELYPFVRFHTFKHGGVTRDFNGLRYLTQTNRNRLGPALKNTALLHRTIADPQCLSNGRDEKENQQRLIRYQNLHKQYFNSERLFPKHPWLIERLHGYANWLLLSRVDIRCSSQGELLVPLQQIECGKVGYHKIFNQDNKDHKRHLILKAGLLNHSFIEIRGGDACSRRTEKVAICEGLMTGLTIGLIWQGPIYVALTANNLKHVRESIAKCSPNAQAYFFADNDQWKPHCGNVGIDKALSAMIRGDIVTAPQFSALSLPYKPTDYNDLLTYEGICTLERQVLVTK